MMVSVEAEGGRIQGGADRSTDRGGVKGSGGRGGAGDPLAWVMLVTERPDADQHN